MSQKISTILFDADGVLQYPGVDYKQAFSKLLGPRMHEADQFFLDIFFAERSSLAGGSDFQNDLIDLLKRWNLSQDADQVLKISTQIKPNESILAMIGALRSAGIQCCLASNQQAYRARFMSETLEYSKCFDREFYSCDIGFVKPDERYFQSIITKLGVSPSSILFIDDQESSVMAARVTGLNAAVFTASLEAGQDALSIILSQFGIVA